MKKLTIAFFLLIVPSVLLAGPITFASDLINESNNITGTNALIAVHPAWAPNGPNYFWISYRADTGGTPGFVVPNVTNPIVLPNPNPPSAIFYENLNIAVNLLGGTITIWADDTARVYLDRPNGTSVLLKDANPNMSGACADGPISCKPNEFAVLSLNNLGVGAGLYTIRIEAYQRGGGPFGVMYTGRAQDGIPDDPTPEPASMGTLAAGLGVIAWWARRRRS